MSTNRQGMDPITELRFALTQGDTENPAGAFRSHLLSTAMAARAPGRPIDPRSPISGLETFRRTTARLSRLLTGLAPGAWSLGTIRDLDVQGLVGHLIGVEQAFAATLRGDDSAAEADHITSTQPVAVRQQGRSAQQTLEEWALATERTMALCADADPQRPVHFHGIQLGLDAFLVVRSFELWTHDEDVRRATGQEEIDPDGEVLTRMTELATALLPAGLAGIAGLAGLAGIVNGSAAEAGASVRLVLTGPGGGSWDIPLQGHGVSRAQLGARIDGHLVVDAAAFCRVVANRADRERSGALVSQDEAAADLLLRGAAALALD